MVLALGLVGCQFWMVPAEDTALVCIDPLMLTSGSDYLCGDEIIVILLSDPSGERFFFDVRKIEGQLVDTNRFVLVNTTASDVVGDVAYTTNDEFEGFNDMLVQAGDDLLIDTPCAEDFVWGDGIDGVCVSIVREGN